MPAKSKSNDNLNKTLYALAAFGTVTTFFGHGMWAIGGKESFVQLMTGSVKNVLGTDMDQATATALVQLIGWADVIIAVLLTLAALGYVYRRSFPVLYRFATSPLVATLFAWGVFWGFVTAASRVTAAGVFYPEIWDLVERGPNFAIPAIGLLLTMRARR